MSTVSTKENVDLNRRIELAGTGNTGAKPKQHPHKRKKDKNSVGCTDNGKHSSKELKENTFNKANWQDKRGIRQVLQRKDGPKVNDQRHPKPSSVHEHFADKLRLVVSAQDVELSKRTIAQERSVWTSLRCDSALQRHLGLLAYASNHFMMQQQQKAFYVQEQIRQAEVAKWLSSKTEEERREYIERTSRPLDC